MHRYLHTGAVIIPLCRDMEYPRGESWPTETISFLNTHHRRTSARCKPTLSNGQLAQLSMTVLAYNE